MPRGASSLPPGTTWDPATGDGTLRAQRYGRDVQRRFHARTLKEVEKTWLKFRREVAAMAQEGAPPPAHLVRRPPPENLVAPTLSEYLDAYWSSIEAGHAEKTKAENRWRLAALRAAKVRPDLPSVTLGDTRLDVISTPMLRYIVATWEEKYAPPTINGYLRILKRVLRDAHARRNPKGTRILREIQVDAWPMLPEEELELELRPEERARLLAVFAGEEAYRDHVRNKSTRSGRQGRNVPWRSRYERFREVGRILVVALETGLRKGDLMDLRWSDLDFKTGHVRRVQNKGRKRRKKPVVIPISPLCMEALRGIAGHRWDVLSRSSELVTAGIGWGRIVRAWGLAKEMARVDRRCRWHDLRHSFGSHLLDLGCDLSDVQKVMGHSSIESTQRYARSGEGSLARVRAAMQSAPKSGTYEKEAKVTDSAKKGAPEAPVSDSAEGI